MRALFTICATCCFIAIFNLPISYYTFLRILVSIGSIAAIYHLMHTKPKANVWAIVFVLILILFNPIYPIYLYKKASWIPLDIVTGILFLLLSFIKNKKKLKEPAIVKLINDKKPFTRDRIVTHKTKLKNN